MSKNWRTIISSFTGLALAFGLLAVIMITITGGWVVRTYPIGSFQRTTDKTESYIYIRHSDAHLFLGSHVTGDLIIIKPENATLVAISRDYTSNDLVISFAWSYPNRSGKLSAIHSPCLDNNLIGNLCATGTGNVRIDQVLVCNAPDLTCIGK